METEDLDKILSKSYAELSQAEKEAISGICASEEEFMQLQQFFASVENYAQESLDESMPSAGTKDRLDALFYETYQSKGILWYNSIWMALYPTEKRFDQRPLVRIAAILVVLISLVPLISKPDAKSVSIAQKEVAKPENKEQALAKDPELLDEAKAKSPAENEVNIIQIEPSEGKISGLMAVTKSNSETLSTDIFINAAPSSATIVMGNATAVASGATTYMWTHPDGIYQDSLRIGEDYEGFAAFGTFSSYSVDQNLAVLDLLTPTF